MPELKPVFDVSKTSFAWGGWGRWAFCTKALRTSLIKKITTMGKKGKKKSKAADGDGNRTSVDEKKKQLSPRFRLTIKRQTLKSRRTCSVCLEVLMKRTKLLLLQKRTRLSTARLKTMQALTQKSKVVDEDKSLRSNQGIGGPVTVKASSDVETDDSVAEVGADAKQTTENETAARAADATTASEKSSEVVETKAKDTEGSEAAAAGTNAAETDGKTSENAVGDKTSAMEAEGSPSAGDGAATDESGQEKKEGGSGGGADGDCEPKGYIGGTVVTWAAATANLREALLAALGVGGAESVQWAEAVLVSSHSHAFYFTFASSYVISFWSLRTFYSPSFCCFAIVSALKPIPPPLHSY